jgi:hypothetical protein
MSKVRYQVMKPCFVNNSYVDPASVKGALYVMAPEGLASEALMLAPEGETIDLSEDVRSGDPRQRTVVDYEADLRHASEQMFQLERLNAELKQHNADLKTQLNTEREARAADAAALEAMAAELEQQRVRPEPQQQGDKRKK